MISREDARISDCVTKAMVLCAGFGRRMQPLTSITPKPLVRLAGHALLDHVLDGLGNAGITDAVVNVHYLADQIERHVALRGHPRICISDERDKLLDTGGGIKKALPLIDAPVFMVHNSDSVWKEGQHSNLARMIGAWDPQLMDGLLLLAPRNLTLGYDGRGDFFLEPSGHIRRKDNAASAPYVFAGVSIITANLFRDIDLDVFSLNLVFDKAIVNQRLRGLVLDGLWMHVGTPEALKEAESHMAPPDRQPGAAQ